MAITLTYQPDKSVLIDNILLLWDTDRQNVRQLLDETFEIADNVIDLSEFHSGDSFQNIIQRRDIYKNYKGQDNFFFLNYDKEDKLRDVEIHYGLEINLNGEMLSFSMDIDKVAELLQNISGDKIQLSHCEYFFKKLKLTVASGEAMGGDWNELSYFFCSKDITHLTDNEVGS